MLTKDEGRAIEGIDQAAMLAQVERWAAINSGTRNLAGLATMAGELADAFAVLPGDIALADPAPVTMMGSDGTVSAQDHGRHLTLSVRPEARVRMLLTGHMDTVYPVDHPFQTLTHRADGTINGPGTADMKGGLATMLAALQAVERTPLAPQIG